MKMPIFKFLSVYSFMSMLIIMMSSLLMSFMMKNLHPLILGMIMLLYSILISLSLDIFNKSSIYSMMMFLIIVGGFLILFLYFDSFAMNNKMISNNILLINFLLNNLMINMEIMISIYKNNLFNMILFLNKSLLELMPMVKMKFYFNNEFNINLIYMKFYSLTLFSMMYLLYTLIIIVKVIFFLTVNQYDN